MNLFLRLPLFQDYCYFLLFFWLAQRQNTSVSLKKLCCWKSGTVSRYPGFNGRFWFSYLSGLRNGQKTSMFTTAKSLFPTNMMLLKIPINCSQLAQDDKASFFGLLWLVLFGHQWYGLKGGLESKDTHNLFIYFLLLLLLLLL